MHTSQVIAAWSQQRGANDVAVYWDKTTTTTSLQSCRRPLCLPLLPCITAPERRTAVTAAQKSPVPWHLADVPLQFKLSKNGLSEI